MQVIPCFMVAFSGFCWQSLAHRILIGLSVLYRLTNWPAQLIVSILSNCPLLIVSIFDLLAVALLAVLIQRKIRCRCLVWSRLSIVHYSTFTRCLDKINFNLQCCWTTPAVASADVSVFDLSWLVSYPLPLSPMIWRRSVLQVWRLKSVGCWLLNACCYVRWNNWKSIFSSEEKQEQVVSK
jgi:hypothetical protein